jgi:hypothetical protein
MKRSSEKSFGILFFIVFAIIGLYPLLSFNFVRVWALVIALIFLFLGLTKPSVLKPLNTGWIKLGEILGKIIAPIVMLLVFFIVITPIGLMLRLFGKDILGLKFSEKVKTYWITRDKNIGPMKRQF